MTAPTIPLNILADLCENVPGFAERVTVRKVYRGENIARQSTARKGLVIPFAQILAGPSARDLGDAAPAIPKAPAATTAPTDATLTRTTAPSNFANVGTPTTLGRAGNTPKQPMNSRPASTLTPESFRPMAEHIAEAVDTAIQARERAYREQLAQEAFNSKRSAFNRITATKSDGKPQGAGNAWGLRNLGGRMAAAALSLTARKCEGQALPTSSAWRPMTGASVKA
jgi:hypothetical protein